MSRTMPAAALAVCLLVAGPATAPGGEFGRVARGLAAPLRAFQRVRPETDRGDEVERLAAQIDWLERHIDTYGSIVAKEPDVWGQSRLLRHRLETEEQLRRQLGEFTARSTAALRRSDQAFLGMALAVQSATGTRRGPPAVTVPEAGGGASAIASIQNLLPTTNEAAGRVDPVVIARTAPFQFPPAPEGFRFDDEPLALEPTVHLDQLARYLSHLQQLRRVNEGDDTADAPGYALNLVRIPVSILPGAVTRKGHGAEITVTAEPCLGPDLLPTAFRSLVINDLVDTIAPALTWCVNDAECLAWAETIAGPAAADAAAEPARRQGVMAAMEALAARLPTISPAAAPAVKTRRSRLPIPFTQLAEVSGMQPIAILVRDTRAALAAHPASRPCIHYLDVRAHLAEELEAAADFLAVEERRQVWAELPAWNLAALVRGRRAVEIAALRCRFLAGVGAEAADVPPELVPLDAGATPGDCCGAEPGPRPLCRTATAVLAWGILVESALLDERLSADVRESLADSGAGPAAACGPWFGPDPSPEARAAFCDHVRRRWPIRVFALDPVREQQNVEESYARRRELQIALALAAASGRMNAQALARFTRRLETDLATIGLNQTAVGFAHGADTFGWRFYPRVQSPPVRGTLAALGEAVCGGPTSDGDLLQRQLEPGQRECTALVVMPSFVSAVVLDVRTNWFSLVHPAATDRSMRQAVRLSRAVQAVRNEAGACGGCLRDYRAGELARLLRRVDQLDRELPLQTLRARIPYENTSGGFELFSAGVTELAPELVGWYGPPGVDPAGTTTLFLVGKGFSVHDTRVIAGGRPVAAALVSREVLEVRIPPGVATLGGACGGHPCATAGRRGGGLALAGTVEPLPEPGPLVLGMPREPLPPAAEAAWPAAACADREVVDVHVATPYGVSGHLLVPVVRSAGRAGGLDGPAFAAHCTLDLTFAAARAAGSRVETARVDEFFASSCDALVIDVPATFIPPAKAELRLALRDAESGETAAVLSFPDPFFDARAARYVIAGGDLRNFVGDTSRPATDKTLRGAVKPWLDALLARGRLGREGDAVTLTLTATLAAERTEVPVAGGLTVRATRRGPTPGEPAEPKPTE